LQEGQGIRSGLVMFGSEKVYDAYALSGDARIAYQDGVQPFKKNN
jgi:hypothetical protein